MKFRYLFSWIVQVEFTALTMQALTVNSRTHTPVSGRVGSTVGSSLSSVTATVDSSPNESVPTFVISGLQKELDNFPSLLLQKYRSVLALGQPDSASLLKHCDRAFHAINCKTGNPTNREIKCKITLAIFGKTGCDVS